MAVVIQLRRGNETDWTNHNPTLEQGEFGVELDTGRFKVGNGTADWATLSYSSGDDGTGWLSGEGAPGSGLGIEGDHYLDSDNGDVYVKGESEWSSVMNIMGPDGPQGDEGPEGPQGDEGPEGPEGPEAVSRLQEHEDQTGAVVLDFNEYRTQVVTQGEGDITYELATLVPFVFEGWDPEIWDFSDTTAYPTLKNNLPPA